MLNTSFSITPPLLQTLQDIEQLRMQLLTIPLSLSNEAKLRFSIQADRIYWALQLNSTPIVKQQVVQLLHSDQHKKPNAIEKEVEDYKKAFDYIRYNWLVNEEIITPKTLLTLNAYTSSGKLLLSKDEIQRLLDYLQVKREHPLIETAIGHLQLKHLSPFLEGNNTTATLFSYLLLYKSGYDFRGLLNLEEYFATTPKAYEFNLNTVIQTGNLNTWLDYFCVGVHQQLKAALETLKQQAQTKLTYGDFFELNDRQKQILAILDKPQTTLTNIKVKKIFKISQITASRDLSKLATLGLIRVQGKGRSTFYSKY